MQRQVALEHRLQALGALREAVGAMRSLSAHHFRRARRALVAGREYRREMETVIAEIGVRQSLHADVPAGLLVVASDLGLCGDYNSRLANLAVAEVARLGEGTIYTVGRRIRGALAGTKTSPRRDYEAAASLEGLPRLLLELAETVLEDYLAARIGSLYVVSAGFEGVGRFAPLSTRVLPIEPIAATRPMRRSPYVEADNLMLAAVREFLYITLYEIFLDAMAAEHGMRLTAAEGALRWLDDTTDVTARRLSKARNDAGTQELLDIVSGGRRLRSEPT